MADYASLKVPDLKKLLTERGLPQTGNKADLVARLQENDKNTAEDVIDWDDDDTKIAPVATKKDAPKPDPKPAPAAVAPAASPPKETSAPAATVPAPAEIETAKPVESSAVAPPATDATPAAEPEKNGDAPAETTDTEKPAAEPVSFAAGLSATDLETEMKKRADRAQRFGIQVDATSDEAKKAERAQRFGVEASAVPKGLDEALPERRPKRGREGGDDRQGGNKRRNPDSRNDGRGRNNQSQGGRGRGRGRGGRDGDRPRGGDSAPSRSILSDPQEKAKAEGRAARFGGDK
ncbi:unnamed protein product [Discula destructiva]